MERNALSSFNAGLINNYKRMTKTEAHASNKGLAIAGGQWLNEALCILSSSVLADSFVLRNPLLSQAPKRQAVKKLT
jgi:hypothetical protein